MALCAVAAGIHLTLSPPPIPSILFHDVKPKRAGWDFWTLSPDKFRELADILDRNGFRGLSLAEVDQHLAGRLPVSRANEGVLLTIDDGAPSAASLVGPELARRGQRATFFIVSGWKPPQAVSADEVRALAKDHDIGSHGRSHDALAISRRRPVERERERIARELTLSQSELAPLAGRPVTALAYPKGEFDAATRELATQAGYRMAFTTDIGYLEVGSDRAELPRFQLNWDTPAFWMEDYLTKPRRERQRSLRLVGVMLVLALGAAFIARPRTPAPAPKS